MKNTYKSIQKIIYMIIISTLLLGCNNQNHINELNREYQKQKSFFLNKFVDHFPQEIKDEFGIKIYSITNEKWTFPLMIMLDDIYNTESYRSRIDSLIDISVEKYNPTDTCLLIVNRFHNKLNEFDYELKLNEKEYSLIDRACYQNSLPIPNFFFNQYSSKKNPIRLEEDFELFVLDAKSGVHWKKEYAKDGRYMPYNWKNGYSKGFAINEKMNVVIYWFIIW
ncbi:MAG: hypothetical protein PVH88_03770 [Ignavibacteria bacterium]|jgi:hypothetical protein